MIGPDGIAYYPWNHGETLTAAALNDAIAQSIAAGNLINVLDSGAKGDGITDDTAAIQGALNAYAGQGTVMIPNTGHPYRTNPLVPPAGSDILIYGTLQGISASNGVLTISNVTGVTVRGTGTIDGGNVTAAGILVNNASNVQIRDVTIQDAGNWNLNVVGSTRVLIDHIAMFGGVSSPQFAQGSSDCWITNSYVNGPNGDGGFAFYGGVTNSGATGNVFTNSFANGCSVVSDPSQPAPCTGIVISGNQVYGNKGQGIVVLASGVGGAHSDITISDNELYGNCTAAVTSGPPACDIFLASCYHSLVANNKLHDCGQASSGIALSGSGYGPCDGLTITGNDISNEGQGTTGGVGIWIAGVVRDLLIGGNHIYDDQTTQTMSFGITGSCDLRTAIVGNHITRTIGAPFSITPSADTVVVNSVNGVWSFGVLPTNAANDAAAATAGIAVGGVYRNGSQLMIRVV